MATKPNTDAIKAALTSVLAWFTVMADGTARPAVLVTATGRINSDDSANSPARLAWRCNGARIPLVGMLAALTRGWDASPKTWPILREVAPSTLVTEGTALYGLDEEHPAVSWDAVADQYDRAIIAALYRATQPDVSAPFDVISAALTPAPEGEKASKLSEQQREMVNAIMNLSETNPARAALMEELTAEGRAEVERRTKVKAEKDARRKEAKAKADAEKTEPEAKRAKATPKK
ncbi:hypothetical protein [Nonomuraea basaltis]|uniref:hypothetical protein n=1 Tax=Nonomuraea basaltis TaxID=2495887 RepID=UPI00110C45AB|nr:hypothetical protein [Nonomuraea basaltis]TMR99542.1 hypothetical protein EJK15_06935 [Nonomuraea basaltis]